METEQIVDENHKKGRVRRKQLLNTILNQMHFYFGDSNLSKDRFLAHKLEESEYVDLNIFLSFNKIAKLTTSVDEIAKALRKSNLLQLNDDGTKVKRLHAIKVKDNEDECIIYVQTIKPDTSHDWLINVFSEFGKVEYVSIPKYAHNKLGKGFAFIEYENEEQVKTALEYFESIGGRISLQIDAEEICSNRTCYNETADQESNQNDSDDLKEVLIDTSTKEDIKKENSVIEKKRKHEDTEEETQADRMNKKHKTNPETEEIDEAKQKKRSSKRKAQIKELGLQVLTKLEWKKLRNRYWEMQRKKMKQLKQHLNKRRLQQSNYLDIKNSQKQQGINENMQIENSEKTTDSISEATEFTPGVIVRLKLSEPWTDAKKVKADFKNMYNSIQYVEIPVTLTSDEVYLRFSTPEHAQEFCGNNSKGEGTVLQNEEEKQYWEKIKINRDACHHKEVKKQRGRDKLLKRAERELGKHIRFDDTNE